MEERFTPEQKTEIFLESVRNISIPAHGDCQPGVPQNPRVEFMGSVRFAIAQCGSCEQEFVTFVFRDTWYLKS
ncbi:hypothetical protein HYZ78_01320 [Candidatus Microgenomates bacterium]|nr:hypothetical protein [Candidatus Microgenomates bacterium]